jgi:transaldolase / glucose-6-phosphate isomerase
MYVEGLVAPDTVNTMPMPTLLAVAERGELSGPTADQDPSAELEALAAAGIDLDDVTAQLLEEGIVAFMQPMEKLLAGIDERREAVVTARPPTIRAALPPQLERAVGERVRKAAAENVAQRVWRRDVALWGEEDTPEIADRLGWLTISDPMLEQAADLHAFAAECRRDGITDAVLLGMGGSSLGPEVIRRAFGDLEGALQLHVLDSTDPAAVAALERRLDLERSMFVVSSKSGGTIETLSHFRYFHARMRDVLGDRAGSRFVAITDPGGPLAGLAREHGFRRVFENAPDIGGRYSVLSYFGLVPAALMGVPIEALLHRCQVAEQNCNSFDQAASNSGLWLGLVMGELALQGRDKLTLAISEPISSFGLWVEQLIAESTGKEGTGIVPVAGEPLGTPEAYGDDRFFAYLRNADDPDAELDARIDALAAAGQPTVTLSVHGATDLGRIFFFSEFATAVAGWTLGINPFDQPNVQEAKDNTAKVLKRFAQAGELPPVTEADEGALSALLDSAAPPHYFAIMGYVEPSPDFDQAIAELRLAVRERTGAATTFGYGPRFLHSTGQLHKGGPPAGVFLQLVHDAEEDLDIPGAGYSFGTLENAQATGDLDTLRAHGLPAERIRLRGDPAAAVRDLTATVKGLVG